MLISFKELKRKRKIRKRRDKILKEIDWTAKDAKEMLEHGWNLNVSIALVCYYSTKKMIDYGMSYPPECTPEEWKKILEQINEGMKLYLEHDEWILDYTDNRAKYDEKKEKVDKAIELVKEWFYTLWD